MDLKTEVARKLKIQGKSKSTFETYWHWIDRYLQFCKQYHIGRETKAEEAIERWLSQLAIRDQVSKNTQNLALQSVCYLYKQVLNRDLIGISAIRAKRPQMVRDIISVNQVASLFSELSGVDLLIARLMYATGLRVGLAVSLRWKDLLWDRRQILVHSAKGDKGRYVCFPEAIHAAMERQRESVRVVHRFDSDGENINGVSLPGAFRRKSPKACLDFGWYYCFPSDRLSFSDERVLCRHHRDPGNLSKALSQAAKRADIEQRVTSHILRHAYATHAHEMGVPLATLQQLLGHNDIRTTQIYAHADVDGVTSKPSPIDAADALAAQLSTPRQKNESKPVLRVVG